MASAGAAAVAAAAAAAAPITADEKYPSKPQPPPAGAAAARKRHDDDDDVSGEAESAFIRNAHSQLALLRKRIAVARASALMGDGGTGVAFVLLHQQQQKRAAAAVGDGTAWWSHQRPARMSCVLKRHHVDSVQVRDASWLSDSVHAITTSQSGHLRVWDTSRWVGGAHSSTHAVVLPGASPRHGPEYTPSCRGMIALDYAWTMCARAHRPSAAVSTAVDGGLVVAEAGLGWGVRIWRTPPLLPRYVGDGRAMRDDAGACNRAASVSDGVAWARLMDVGPQLIGAVGVAAQQRNGQQPVPVQARTPDVMLPSDYYVPAMGWGARHELVVGSGDGHVRLWDIERAVCTGRVSTCVALADTGNDVSDLSLPRANVDGRVCAAACQDGVAYACDFRVSASAKVKADSTGTGAAAATKPVAAVAPADVKAAAGAGAGAGRSAAAAVDVKGTDAKADAAAMYGVELTAALPGVVARAAAPPAPGAVALVGMLADDPTALPYSSRYNAQYRPASHENSWRNTEAARPHPQQLRESELGSVVCLGAHGNAGDGDGGGGGGFVFVTSSIDAHMSVWDLRSPLVPLATWYGATAGGSAQRRSAAAAGGGGDEEEAVPSAAPRVAFSASGRWVMATGGSHGGSDDVYTYDVLRGGTLCAAPWRNVHEQRVTSVALSPDGRRVLTSSYDGHARVYDADD